MGTTVRRDQLSQSVPWVWMDFSARTGGSHRAGDGDGQTFRHTETRGIDTALTPPTIDTVKEDAEWATAQTR